jgi:hypothetical protein
MFGTEHLSTIKTNTQELIGGVEMMSESARRYLPAAGHDWSLPLYDPIVKLLGGDNARRVLLHHAATSAGLSSSRYRLWYGHA